MTALLTPVLLVALTAAVQIPKAPAKDLFLHSARAPGIEVRFVDYHWQPALFEALEKGSRDVPEAQRDWVVARLMIDQRPMTFEGARLGVGSYALTLWPNLDGKGMAVEVRRVDMRDVFPNLNAMAPAPRGETMHKGPARFEPQDPPALRLEMGAAEEAGAVVLTLRYGDKRLALKLTR